ncbi:hypothetical protein NA57DRAFT_72931 [Rhizodiscina lignyota]|uniref:Uncharacterized protein n=1 Tax=Rhizodiscina lignyota TaxID=1504668 RepID=A0A9P4INR7_9PEZI|nr:hypothetical protein NA57DRAFT_72931 [Rhizodiscina lignyota]
MKTTTIAAAFASMAALVTADILISVDNGAATRGLDRGAQFVTTAANEQVIFNATSITVLSHDVDEFGVCVAYGNTECNANPNFGFDKSGLTLPSDIAGKLGCILCI